MKKKTGRPSKYGEPMIYVTHYIPQGIKQIVNELIKQTIKTYQERKIRKKLDKIGH